MENRGLVLAAVLILAAAMFSSNLNEVTGQQVLNVRPNNPSTICGDNICHYTESCVTCLNDCAPTTGFCCGDSVCGQGEIITCPSDCQQIVSGPAEYDNSRQIISQSAPKLSYVVTASNYHVGFAPSFGKAYVYSGVDGDLLWSKEGEAFQDFFGYSIGVFHDLNGDRYEDVIVGARYFDGAAGPFTGKIYVYSGADGELLWSKEGENNVDEYGTQVSSLSDINGDGFGDVIVGARFFDSAAGQNTGKIYVYSGVDGDLIWSKEGETFGDNYGSGVSGIADLNADGFGDVIVGAPGYNGAVGYNAGKVYVYSGVDGDLIWSKEGENIEDLFGEVVKGTKDLNVDGFGDVIIGTRTFDGAAGQNTGKVYVYSGVDGDLIWSKEGENINDSLGSDIGNVLNLNGQRTEKILVSASGYDGTGGLNSGRVYAYNSFNGDLLWSKDGEHPGDSLKAVSGLSDLNNDQVRDVIVGSKYVPVPLIGSFGGVYLLSGEDGSTISEIIGENFHDFYGSDVAGTNR